MSAAGASKLVPPLPSPLLTLYLFAGTAAVPPARSAAGAKNLMPRLPSPLLTLYFFTGTAASRRNKRRSREKDRAPPSVSAVTLKPFTGAGPQFQCPCPL